MSGISATSTAVELAAAIRAKEISSRELLDLYVDRIERLDRDKVNAVVTLDVERARAAAAAADEALARGDDVGPLHGLPLTIKDAIETEGIRSTGGAVELADHVPLADAPAVARLKAAGAIVFGKTNLPRWSGDSQACNELFGTTNNPWSFAHVPGGSSGGSAAAVAAGFTAFELGTDISGSVRLPAHSCGVFSLKPSYGVIPNLGYLDHVGGGTTRTDINTFGPIARSAADLELAVSVLAGPVPQDAPAWRVELPECSLTSLAGVRVATWLDDDTCSVGREYLGHLRAAADALSDAGAVVEDGHPDVGLQAFVDLHYSLLAAAISPSWPEDRAEAISGSHLRWLRNDETRAAYRCAWAEWFEGYDVLLAPVAAIPAYEHNQEGEVFDRQVTVDGELRSLVEVTQWVMPFSVTGLPSSVVPIARNAAGLPLGMQVVAPYLHDRRAMRVAGLVSEVVGGYEVPPGFE
jgi:amidase